MARLEFHRLNNPQLPQLQEPGGRVRSLNVKAFSRVAVELIFAMKDIVKPKSVGGEIGKLEFKEGKEGFKSHSISSSST
jgi:hypothetical protein